MYKSEYKKKKNKGFSQQQTKRNNTTLLFNLIRKHSPISRVELSKITKLSATTVSFLVEDLIEKGFLYEKQNIDIPTKGRRPTHLYIKGTGGYFFVIELFGKSYSCSLYDLNVKKIGTYKVSISSDDDIEISETMLEFLKDFRIDIKLLMGINIVVPGRVGKENTDIIAATVLELNLDKLRENFAEIKKVFPNAMIKANNVSSIYSYSEHYLGSKIRNVKQMTINISEGISSALLVTDEEGDCSYFFPVEIGHMIIDMDGKRCNCGNKGCFEAVCNVVEIIKCFNNDTGADLKYEIGYESDINIGSLKEIATQINNSKEKISNAIKSIVHKVAIGLVGVVNADQPDLLFISGSVKHLGSRFIDMLNQEMKSFNLMNDAGEIDIKYSRVDDESKREGATNMLIDLIFSFDIDLPSETTQRKGEFSQH